MSLKLKAFLLSTLSGLLLWLAWPSFPTTFLIFFAFVPLLYAEHLLADAKQKGFWYYNYWMMFLWNAGTTWWIYNSTAGGGIFSVIANAFMMTAPFAAFRLTKQLFGKRVGYLSLVVYFVGFEYLHLNWDIAWPWLTLGNVFAIQHNWIQWYEFTGILGGSVWVLLANLIVLSQLTSKKLEIIPSVIKVLLIILLPIGLSYWIGSKVIEDGETISLVAVQPNIDPFGEKFESPVEIQMEKMIDLSNQAIGSKQVDVVLWPETAIQGSNREITFTRNEHFTLLSNFLLQHPNTALLSGLESWEIVPENSNPAFTKFSKNIGFYQTYNAGLWMNGDSVEIYHKSKFVPGVEAIPFPKVLGFFEDLIDFSAAGTYAPQNKRSVFETKNGIKIAPIICYESIFGDFIREYVTNGAEVLTIITNDGWWGDTEGHKHHNLYAKLRAIETRRPVVRSANTGISSFINIHGDILQQSRYWEPAALYGEVRSSSKITFFTKYGDYIGRSLAFLSIVLFLSTLVRKKTEKFR